MPGQKQLWTSIFADLARTCHASLTMDGVAVPADRVAQATTDRVLRSACEAPPVIGTTPGHARAEPSGSSDMAACLS